MEDSLEVKHIASISSVADLTCKLRRLGEHKQTQEYSAN